MSAKPAENQTRPGPQPRCTQPNCYLQQPGIDKAEVADFVVSALEHEYGDELVPASFRIERREVCRDCVMRVMQERAPYLTDEQYETELKKLAKAGHWSYRRYRRRA